MGAGEPDGDELPDEITATEGGGFFMVAKLCRTLAIAYSSGGRHVRFLGGKSELDDMPWSYEENTKVETQVRENMHVTMETRPVAKTPRNMLRKSRSGSR